MAQVKWLSTGDPNVDRLTRDLVQAFNALETQALTIASEAPSSFVMSGVLTPDPLTTDQNNYAPTDLRNGNTLRLEATGAARTITGLSGGAKGRIMILHNVGTLDITLSDESSSSLETNRFALGAAITLAADTAALLHYDSVGKRWRAISHPAAASAPPSAQYLTLATDSTLSAERVLTPGRHLLGTDAGAGSTYTVDFRHDPRYLDEFDEFFGAATTSGAIGKLGWLTGGTGAFTMAPIAGLTDHPGAYRLTTAAVNPSTAYFGLSGAAGTATFPSAYLERFTWIVSLGTVTNVELLIGLGTDVSNGTLGTEGAFFRFASASSANWSMQTRLGGAPTITTSSVPVNAGSWYVLECVRNASGNFEFYINGTLIATHTATKPVNTLNFGAYLITTTNAARTLDVDFARLRSIQMGNRYT